MPDLYDLYLEKIHRGKIPLEEIRFERFSALVRKILNEDVTLPIAIAFREAVERERIKMENGE